MSDDTVTRRLAAVLHADVAGYSKLMGRDEEGTVRAIRAQLDIVQRVVGSYRGRVADFTGDAFLAEFGSAIDAVGAALAIQAESERINHDRPAESHFRLRIGLHLGEVRVEGDRIFGDTIHVAARLQTLAPPGGLCLSSTVRDQLTGKLDLALTDIGLQPLKHIDRPVHAFAHHPEGVATHPAVTTTTGSQPRILRRTFLLGTLGAGIAAGAAYFLFGTQFNTRPVFDNSIAVLPFKNLGTDASQDWFPEGITSEIRSTLQRSDHFRVLASTSSKQFQNESLDAVTLASRLGVAWLLDGSVRHDTASTVRISAELINGGDGISLWSESFQRTLNDVFAIQGEIATAVVKALSRIASGVEDVDWAVPVTIGGTDNSAAYEAWLRGRALYDKAADVEGERLALEQFNTAVSLDGAFALAHASRARSLLVLGNQSESIEARREHFASAQAAAQRAIDLAPNLADAHALLGLSILEGKLNVGAAGQSFDQALRLGGGDASVLGAYASWAISAGKLDAAMDAAHRARNLDPLNPLVHAVIGDVFYAQRKYRDAIVEFEKTLEAHPNTAIARYAIGKCQFLLGDASAARKSFDAEPAEHARLTGLALADYKLGDVTSADAHLNTLIEKFGDSMLYQQAMILTQRGDAEGALNRLQNAWLLEDSGLVRLGTEPLFDGIEGEITFTLLRKSLGLQ